MTSSGEGSSSGKAVFLQPSSGTIFFKKDLTQLSILTLPIRRIYEDTEKYL
jgi:hypothetical protein